MKTKMKIILAVLALGASAFAVSAQDNNPPGNGGPNDWQGGPGGPGKGHRPPPPAIIAALDANHDGVIDADEIANAPAALKALDKNGDGVLTPDEFDGRPHPPGPRKSPGGNANHPGDNGAGGPPDDMPPGPPPGEQ
jgi:hypothetical protein